MREEQGQRSKTRAHIACPKAVGRIRATQESIRAGRKMWRSLTRHRLINCFPPMLLQKQ